MQLSGIVLSHSSGEEPNENIFTIADAYDLTINADLVILSCCETGIGEMREGEGMMAMNRGFLFAARFKYYLYSVQSH